jgi:hypothetical protein
MPDEHVVEQPLTGVLHGVGSTRVAARVTALVGDSGTRRRRWVLIATVALLLLLGGGIATGLALCHLDHQYGPLQAGAFGGPYAQRGFEVSKDGFSYHLSEAPNATGQLIASLDNLGAHSVQVTSIETNQIAAKIQWSVYRVSSGSSLVGLDTPWRPFPATVPANGTIRLLITIHHPSNCAQYPKYHGVSDARYTATHWVNWESLLHDHRTLMRVWEGGDDGIRVC